MSFIHGIGDEVTLFFVVLLVFLLAALITLIGNNPTISNARTRQRWRGTPELANESVRETAIQRQRVSNRHSPNSQTIEELDTDDQPINNDDTLNNSSDNQIDTDRNFETDAEIPASNILNNEEEDSTPTHTVAHENAEEHSPEPAQDAEETPEDFELPNIPRDEIRVRLKYLDDTEKIVTTSLSTNIGDFKRKHFREDLRSNKIVRLIFAGHLLNNNSTIQHCRIIDNSVVHVQVLPAPTTQSVPEDTQESELDLSLALWPILTVILSLCWLAYFKYPEFYNSLSLGILLLFSGCYFYFLSRVRV